jgi:Protein of unknown function (DUF3800)
VRYYWSKENFAFSDWATLFPVDIFMKAVIVYADESGTHDRRGIQPGSEYPTIAGFAAVPNVWKSFCVNWSSVLKRYNAPYFHAREFRLAKSAIENKKPTTKELEKNPYINWDLKKLDDFLETLAKMAGGGNKITIAGVIRTRVFHEIREQLKISNPDQIQWGDDPYKYSMGEFFNVCRRELFYKWGDFNSPIVFFFDQSDDPRWREAIHEVYSAFAKKDLRMQRCSFVDKKEAMHIPLQAADMLAYRIRWISEKMHKGDYEPNKIDALLLKSVLKPVAKKNPNVAEFLRRMKDA